MDHLPANFGSLTFEQQQTYLHELLDDSSDGEEEMGNDANINSSDDYLPSSQEAYANEESDVEDVCMDRNVRILVYNGDSSSDSELEKVSGVDGRSSGSAKTTFLVKDKSVWLTTAPPVHRTPKENIVRHKPGPAKATQGLSIAGIFKKLFTTEMCTIVVRETNRKATAVYKEQNNKNADKPKTTWKLLTEKELYAFIGILITAGVHHSNNEHCREMWKTYSLPLYRATMSINRFSEICRFIRFDNNLTRDVRLQTDKAAARNDIWMMLNANLFSNYIPGDCLTVDEQLYPYRGKTRFTIYMPSKPAKYGIKIWWVCDAATSYPLSGQIYTGKSQDRREVNQGQRVVSDLCHKFTKSGSNITCDNFFTSMPLARLLLSWNLTLVGTLKQSKPYIPSEMKKSKEKEEQTSVFGFSEDGKLMLCSYVPKKGRNVIMLSTMHKTAALSENKRKPEVIEFYNKTKGELDNMDKMLSHFSCKRTTRRWPFALFFNIIDIAALAAFIIYVENNTAMKGSTHKRRSFLKDLGRELVMATIEERMEARNIIQHYSTRAAIEAMVGYELSSSVFASTSTTMHEKNATGRKKHTGICYVCLLTERNKRKTRKSCDECKKPICLVHTNVTNQCPKCKEQQQN